MNCRKLLLGSVLLSLGMQYALAAPPSTTSLLCTTTQSGKAVINEVNADSNFVELYLLQTVDILNWSLWVDDNKIKTLGKGNCEINGTTTKDNESGGATVTTWPAGTFITCDRNMNPSNNEVLLIDKDATPTAGNTTVIDYLSYGTPSPSAYWSVPGACGTLYPAHAASNKDIARVPDGTGALSDNGNNVTKGTTNSPASINHYEIDVPSVGLTCQSATVTVRACASATAPCTGSLATAATSTTLSASSGSFTNAGGATQSFTGSANYALSVTSPATVTIGLSLPVATPKCYSYDGSTRTLLASCAFDVKKAAFLFDVPNFKAGDGSGPVTLSALREDDNTKKCVSFVPSGGVKMWTTYLDPATGTKQATLSVGASTTTLPTSKPGSGNVTLSFDASGQASFALDYLDAGKLQLDAEWNSITGSDTFVVKPYFALSGIACADGTANPGATTAAGAKFCRAGQAFSVTARAVAKDGATATPNFGRESTPEGARLTAALVAPVGGSAPALSGSFGAFADVGGARQASGSTFAWPEVGIISLTPGIADSDYLGAGDVTETVVANVGRFYPDHFETTLAKECSGAFTYSGQPFSLHIAAYRVGGSGAAGITTNYDGALGFSKIVTVSGIPAVAAGAGAITGGDVAGQPTQFSAAKFTRGETPPLPTIGSVLRPTFTFNTKPSPATTVAIRAADSGIDSDGVSSIGAVEGDMEVRSGRLYLTNAYGSELLNLPVPAQTQYWTSTGWVSNLADSCSSLTKPTAANGGLIQPLSSKTQSVPPAPPESTVSGGKATFVLQAPGAGNTGVVDLVADKIVHDKSPWLEPSPNARACFGICGPRSPVIYQRERY